MPFGRDLMDMSHLYIRVRNEGRFYQQFVVWFDHKYTSDFGLMEEII
jgi:hypothetical protein